MLSRLKKNNNEGFTIIEVMIVLAIAGLILLIVFLAVPALQRSARNTQRKNDIGALATGISNFETNNAGSNITSATYASGQVTLKGPSGTSNVTDVRFGYYTAQPTVSACGVTSGACTGINYGRAPSRSPLAKLLFPSAYAATTTAVVGPDNVTVLTGATCNGNAVPNAGNARSYAIMYELEQNGSSPTTGGVAQCQGS